MKTSRTLKFSLLLGSALAGLASQIALADPPSWAPAWGRRSHEGHNVYRGYDGRDWDRDYGVYSRGRCNTDEILAVTGAVAGGVIGNRSARPENRGVATVLGAVIGAVVGNAIGEGIDDSDRACMGHSLELVPTGHVVTWRNPRTRVLYRLTPRRDLDRYCREFDLRAEDGRDYGTHRLRACRDDDGDWQMSSLNGRAHEERHDRREDREHEGHGRGHHDRDDG